MRARVFASIVLPLVTACGSDPEPGAEDGDASETVGEDEATSTSESESDTEGSSETGEAETSDTQGPADLPTPTGTCPSFASGNLDFAPADIGTRTVKLWMADEPSPGGPLILYWHAYTSAPDEVVISLSPAVIAEITAAGGVIAAPYPAGDVGQFPWFVVNGSNRQDDMLLADEIVACAIQEVGIDPNRIHTSGMSAGGLQTVAFSMARSRYLASVASFSGGVFSPLAFEDPSNHFAAMIFHGGDQDIFGGTVNFKELSINWFEELIDNGNFAFMCDHGGGHTIPQGVGDDVWRFFQDHPFGTDPEPYGEGLPAEFPSYCGL
ncbi:hypothetical protein ACNOYE_03730 [Nannocystaceae bacterium ST9]